jgi:hypothetical protein
MIRQTVAAHWKNSIISKKVGIETKCEDDEANEKKVRVVRTQMQLGRRSNNIYRSQEGVKNLNIARGGNLHP